MELVMLRRDMETSLQEGDVSAVFDLSTNLLDVCNMYLYIADKQLRDRIGELRSLTRGIVGSVMP
jgi:phosphoenolpyruvate-protein kinase (PTS system EI component)